MGLNPPRALFQSIGYLVMSKEDADWIPREKCKYWSTGCAYDSNLHRVPQEAARMVMIRRIDDSHDGYENDDGDADHDGNTNDTSY